MYCIHGFREVTEGALETWLSCGLLRPGKAILKWPGARKSHPKVAWGRNSTSFSPVRKTKLESDFKVTCSSSVRSHCFASLLGWQALVSMPRSLFPLLRQPEAFYDFSATGYLVESVFFGASLKSLLSQQTTQGNFNGSTQAAWQYVDVYLGCHGMPEWIMCFSFGHKSPLSGCRDSPEDPPLKQGLKFEKMLV